MSEKPDNLKLLKRVVISMGVLLFAGTIFIFSAIIVKISDSAKCNANLELEKLEGKITAMTKDKDELILAVESDDDIQHLYKFNLCNGDLAKISDF